MVKQVIVMRKDLKMTKGKMIAQGSHASLGVILSMMEKTNDEKDTRVLRVDENNDLKEWLNGIYTKICVYVNSEEELLDIYNKAKSKGLPLCLIEDVGHTMFHGVKTKTCLAIGPVSEEKVNPITGNLKLL